MSTRHRWDKTATHHYRCRQCGLDKLHVMQPDPDPRAQVRWATVFSRDGVEVAREQTPPCPGRPPLPTLTWTRASRYHETANTGHAVSASRGLDGVRYSAWGPDQAPGAPYYAWPPDDQALVTYPRGVRVPMRFPLLGVFAAANAARARCAEDAGRITPTRSGA